MAPHPITLTLDAREAALLGAALQSVLHTLREELVHTGSRAFRDDLRQRLDALERVESRLREVSGGASAAPPP
jgi:hypothetical protein